jgi:hypothetical protein
MVNKESGMTFEKAHTSGRIACDVPVPFSETEPDCTKRIVDLVISVTLKSNKEGIFSFITLQSKSAPFQMKLNGHQRIGSRTFV